MRSTDSDDLKQTDFAFSEPLSTRNLPWWKDRKLWWESPEPALLHASARGESIFSFIRLLIIALLTVIPIRNLLQYPDDFEHVIGLSVVVTALAIAFVVFLALKRGYYQTWVGLTTSILDVSLVSTALTSFLLIEHPYSAVNSKVVFPCYFLALGATCLRNDPRISLVAGGTAFLQYLGIITFADLNWNLNDPQDVPFTMGMFSWNAQVGRLILLFSATLLNTAITARNKYLLLISCHDPLTGLLNRREFDHRLQDEANRAFRYRHPLTIAMVDIDDFKLLNDALGHRLGDEALRMVGRSLLAAVRREDLVARYGGDEFVVLFPETDPEEAEIILSRINKMIASDPLEDTGRRLRISAGVAGWPLHGSSIEEVFHLADRRLYELKRESKEIPPGASP